VFFARRAEKKPFAHLQTALQQRNRTGAPRLVQGAVGGAMLCGVGGAANGLRARLASVAEQKFCRPLGGDETSWAPPRPEDRGVGMSWVIGGSVAHAERITVDPFPDHASRTSWSGRGRGTGREHAHGKLAVVFGGAVSPSINA
jgi:hypothetical protein